jgi:hypothetical protein
MTTWYVVVDYSPSVLTPKIRYKRHEVQTRLVCLININCAQSVTILSIAFFTMITIVAGGISPLLAYACGRLNGKGGLDGWRWIFVCG